MWAVGEKPVRCHCGSKAKNDENLTLTYTISIFTNAFQRRSCWIRNQFNSSVEKKKTGSLPKETLLTKISSDSERHILIKYLDSCMLQQNGH